MWQTVLSGIALTILKRVASFAWEVLWTVVTDAMEEAEKSWTEVGSGKVKKEWVMSNAMRYVDTLKLNFISHWIVKTFISRVIDSLIEKLNQDFEDHKWLDYIKDLKVYCEKYIPFI